VTARRRGAGVQEGERMTAAHPAGKFFTLTSDLKEAKTRRVDKNKVMLISHKKHA
jgi:hypothetical protein